MHFTYADMIKTTVTIVKNKTTITKIKKITTAIPKITIITAGRIISFNEFLENSIIPNVPIPIAPIFVIADPIPCFFITCEMPIITLATFGARTTSTI